MAASPSRTDANTISRSSRSLPRMPLGKMVSRIPHPRRVEWLAKQTVTRSADQKARAALRNLATPDRRIGSWQQQEAYCEVRERVKRFRWVVRRYSQGISVGFA